MCMHFVVINLPMMTQKQASSEIFRQKLEFIAHMLQNKFMCALFYSLLQFFSLHFLFSTSCLWWMKEGNCMTNIGQFNVLSSYFFLYLTPVHCWSDLRHAICIYQVDWNIVGCTNGSEVHWESSLKTHWGLHRDFNYACRKESVGWNFSTSSGSASFWAWTSQ